MTDIEGYQIISAAEGFEGRSCETYGCNEPAIGKTFYGKYGIIKLTRYYCPEHKKKWLVF